MSAPTAATAEPVPTVLPVDGDEDRQGPGVQAALDCFLDDFVGSMATWSSERPEDHRRLVH